MAGGVTTLGKAAIVGVVTGVGSQTAYDSTNCYIACGTGTTAFAVTDTTLGAEITTASSGLVRVKPDTISRETTTTTNDTMRFVKAFTVAATGDGKVIGEWGIFNASSAGVMLARDVPSSTTTVATGDVLTWTFDVILS